MSRWERAALLGGWTLALLADACAIDERQVEFMERSSNPSGEGSGQGGAAPALGSADPTNDVDQMAESGLGGATALSENAPAAGGAAGSAVTNVPGAAGSGLGAAGGTMPTGGSAGAAGGLGATSGTGLALNPVNGWVNGQTNGVGIQGYFVTVRDAGGSSTISPADFSSSGSDICVHGAAAQVPTDENGSPDFSNNWGVLVGLDLAVPAAGGGPGPWSRVTTAGTVVGFSFTLSGPSIPDEALRFSALGADGQEYCVQPLGASGASELILSSQLATECWSPGQGQPLPASLALTGLRWTVVTSITAPVPYDFCITNLRAVVN